MTRMNINSIDDIMTAASGIIEMSAKQPDIEVWHPSLVWGAPNRTEEEWEEIISHAPKAMSIRVTTPYRTVTIRDIWHSPEFLNTTSPDGAEAYDIRLELLVARAIKRFMGGGCLMPTIVDVGVDWDTAVPVVVSGVKIPRRRRRPRRS